MPLAQPTACQRSSSSTMRSRYETTLGSSKTRAAVSNETPCFRRLMRFLFSSQAKTMCIYKSVAHRKQGFARRDGELTGRQGADPSLKEGTERRRSMGRRTRHDGRSCRLA